MMDRTLTFSKNVFIPLTDACRNRCGYCSFRADEPRIMSRTEVIHILKRGAYHGCKEALFTFGEKPETHPAIMTELEDWGYSNVVEYLYDLCLDAIDLGLLPHSNPGSISRRELELLKDVNASMGLMLESSSEKLCKKGMPHEKSPGKRPKVRLNVLEGAGMLGIPFTTGILIGIGESDEDVERSISALAKIQDKYGHIQELIVQNFRPKKSTPMAGVEEPSVSRILAALRHAKKILEVEGLQVPPNLNRGREGIFLHHGANDFGGISPVTSDYVNPGDRWPTVDRLRSVARRHGFELRERLPVYPGFIEKAPERLRSMITSYVDSEGLVNDTT